MNTPDSQKSVVRNIEDRMVALLNGDEFEVAGRTARLTASFYSDAASANRFTLIGPTEETKDLADSVIEVTSEEGRKVAGRIVDVRPGEELVLEVGLLARKALRGRTGGTVNFRTIEPRPLSSVTLLVGAEHQTVTAKRFENAITEQLQRYSSVLYAGAILKLMIGETLNGTMGTVLCLEPEIGIITKETEVEYQYVSELQLSGLSRFEDVGGVGDLLKELQMVTRFPLLHPGLFYGLGITPPRGILFYGPPGTGKTYVARALANEMGVHCIPISGPDIVGQRYGDTETNLRHLFGDAIENAPAIVLIDEIDAIAPKRGESGSEAENRAVGQLLALMDGLVSLDGVLIIGTTNRLDSLDPALRRAGRFDTEVFLGPPDEKGRREILDVHTRLMPLDDAVFAYLDVLAERTSGYVGADLMQLCREAGLSAAKRFQLASVVGGVAEDPNKIAEPEIRVTIEDFASALERSAPSLGRAVMSGSEKTWQHLRGLDHDKELLRRYANRFIDEGVSEGIVLTGPPGSGKTELAKGLAAEFNMNLMVIHPSDIFSKWSGESEQHIRAAFSTAAQLAPSILLLDQLDGLAPSRGRDQTSYLTNRVVNELLVQLEAATHATKVLVIGTTDRLDLVDDAITRPGRLGSHIHLGTLTPVSAQHLFVEELERLKVDVPENVLAKFVAADKLFTAAQVVLLARQAKDLCEADSSSVDAQRFHAVLEQALANT